MLIISVFSWSRRWMSLLLVQTMQIHWDLSLDHGRFPPLPLRTLSRWPYLHCWRNIALATREQMFQKVVDLVHLIRLFFRTMAVLVVASMFNNNNNTPARWWDHSHHHLQAPLCKLWVIVSKTLRKCLTNHFQTTLQTRLLFRQVYKTCSKLHLQVSFLRNVLDMLLIWLFLTYRLVAFEFKFIEFRSLATSIGFSFVCSWCQCWLWNESFNDESTTTATIILRFTN